MIRVSAACAVQRMLIRVLLPATFRAEAGAAMAAAFEEAAAAAAARGSVALPALLAREAVDLLVTGRRLRSHAPARSQALLGTLRSDVRQSVRALWRVPGFSLVAVGTLALGIGAVTAVWTLTDGVLFRPLAHADPDALFMVAQTNPEFGDAGLPMSYPNYADLRSGGGTGFADLAAWSGPGAATVDAGSGAESLRATRITPNAFALLGNGAFIGRPLRAADGEPGAAPVVVVSEALWRSRLGGGADAVGRTVRVEGVPHEVVGVMPAAFAFPMPGTDLWLPLRADAANPDRDTNDLRVIGRLAPGVTSQEALARTSAAMARLVEAYPADNAGKGIRLTSRRDAVVGNARPVMRLMLGAALLLLLLACANLANLLLARGVVRGRELAVRSALGAGRARIRMLLLIEACLLAVPGGILGVALARLLVDGLTRLAPADLPRLGEVALDGRALVVALAATGASTLLFGLLPALRVPGDPADALRDGARGSIARHRGLRALVVAQLGLALVLVSAGALLAVSFQRLVSVDPGFDPRGVWSFRVALPESRYGEPARVLAFYDRLLGGIAALPNVASAGATWALPFSGDFASGRVTVEGRPLPAGSEPFVGLVPIRGAYFETLRRPLVAGRSLEPSDDAAAPPVVVVNRTAADRLWPGEDAVGKRFRRGRAEETDLPWITVVGVVADAHGAGLAAEVEPEMFWTQAQAAWARDMTIVVRATGDATALAAPVRRILATLDPALPLTRPGLLAARVSDSVAAPRFRTVLLLAFSALALLVAVVGTYGVMAFVVVQRKREIGVRMALGARGGQVLRGVLRDGLVLVAFAAVPGLIAAAAGSRLLSGLLFRVDPLDLRIHLAATFVLAAAALVACWLPARRAAAIDPVRTLRE